MRFKLLVAFTAVIALTSRAPAQSSYFWSGNAASSVWGNNANWTGVALGGMSTSLVPGVDGAVGTADGTANDIAFIGPAGSANNPPTTSVSINTASGNFVSLGAIIQASAKDLAIINSIASSSRILQLNGAYAGNPLGLSTDTLISVGIANLTLQNTSASQTLGVRLGIANGAFEVGRGRTLTLNSNITELNAGSGFTLRGGGSLILGGTNSYTGAVNVQNGLVRFTSAASVGGTGADITVGASGAVAFNYSLADSDAFAALLASRVVSSSSGTIALAQNGLAVNFSSLGLNFPNAYLGAVGSVTAGTFTPADDNVYRLGGGGGTLTLGQNILTGSVLIGGGGGGTVILSGANEYSGSTTISKGTLLFNSASAVSSNAAGRNITVQTGGAVGFPFADATQFQAYLSNSVDLASAGAVVLSSAAPNNQSAFNVDFNAAGLTSAFLGATGAVSYSGTYTPSGAYRLGGGGGSLTYSAGITGGASVIIGGANGGSVTLSGSNSFTGGLVVKPGATLNVTAEGNLGGTANIVTLEGGTLNTGSISTTSRQLRVTGDATIITANSGTTALQFNNRIIIGEVGGAAPNLTLISTPDLSGAILGQGTGGLLLNTDVTLYGNASLGTTSGIQLGGTGDRTITVYSTFSGAGGNNFRGNFDFAGRKLTFKGAGIVNLGAGGGPVTGNTGGIVIDGPTVRFQNTNSAAGNRDNAFTGGVQLISGVAVLGSPYIMFGTGALRLSGGYVRTDTATTRDVTNTLVIDGNASFGAASGFGNINFTGASQTISNNPVLTFLGNITSFLPSSGSIALNSDATFTGAGTTVLGALNFGSTARTITKSGTGTLTLNGAASNAVAGTQLIVANGTTLLGNVSALASGITTVTLGSATGNTSGVFDLNSLSPTLAGLTSAGSGAGNQVINSGSSSSALTVSYSGGSPQTFAGRLGGGATGNNFSFTKTGSGTSVLTGSNTYTGATLVSLGKLVVNGSLANGLVTVNVDAALGGIGVIAGPLVVDGTLAPGDASGSLTLNDAVTLNGTYEFQPGDGLAIGASGSLTLGSSSQLIATGLTASNYTIATFTAGTRSGTFDTLDLTPGYSIEYNATSIVLTAIPEPSSILGLAAVATLVAGRIRSRLRRELPTRTA